MKPMKKKEKWKKKEPRGWKKISFLFYHCLSLLLLSFPLSFFEIDKGVVSCQKSVTTRLLLAWREIVSMEPQNKKIKITKRLGTYTQLVFFQHLFGRVFPSWRQIWRACQNRKKENGKRFEKGKKEINCAWTTTWTTQLSVNPCQFPFFWRSTQNPPHTTFLKADLKRRLTGNLTENPKNDKNDKKWNEICGSPWPCQSPRKSRSCQSHLSLMGPLSLSNF